jgi:phosphoribosyl-AMP cyclohydrolase
MLKINFDDNGLVPVIAQDVDSMEVMMLAYVNQAAIDRTIATGFAHYYSRSRGKIWKKGEESGNVQEVVRILVDCDEDTLVYQIRQKGKGACHTGYEKCFYRTIEGEVVAKKMFDPDSVYKKDDEKLKSP